MDLTMEGRKVLPQPGQSLLELVKQLGLDGSTLTERPLAAKIAGEVFTLNYIPVRQKEAEADRQSMRRAMAASNGEIRLLRYADPAGKECYIRTAQFTIFLAMRQLWPEATAKMTCTLGSSVYISVAGAKDFSASTLKARVSELVGQDIPLIRRRIKLQKAIDRFREEGQTDKARLLSWRTVDYFDEYAYGEFADYYYGEMMPSTGYLTVWDILPADGGFVFVYPDDGNPEICAKVPPMPNFFSVFNEGERWADGVPDGGRPQRPDEFRPHPGADPGQRSPARKAVFSGGRSSVPAGGEGRAAGWPQFFGQDDLGQPPCNPTPRPWEKAHSHESGRLLHRPGQNCPRP